MATYTPGIRQRTIAKRLIAWRESVDMTGAEAAGRTGWSASKQTRLELARQEITPADVMTLALVYGIPEDERTKLFNRTQASMTPGWWDRIEKGAVTDDYRDYIELEADARRVRVFQLDVVHGVFQERDYGIEQGRWSAPEVDDAVIIAGVDARVQRQGRLHDDDGVHIEAVFAESILYNSQLPPEVMRKQRRKLIELAQLPSVDLRILASDGGAPPVATGFSLLSFNDDDPDVGYIELPGGGVFLEDKEKVELFSLAFGRLWGNEETEGIALDTEESLELIAAIDR